MQLVFAACRRKKTFFVDFRFATRWAHFFDFIARSHTLLFSSSFTFCFSFFPSYYWVATAHNARNVVVVYCYNLKGCVCVRVMVCILVRKFSRILSSQGIEAHTRTQKRRLRELKPKPIEPKNLSHFVRNREFSS